METHVARHEPPIGRKNSVQHCTHTYTRTHTHTHTCAHTHVDADVSCVLPACLVTWARKAHTRRSSESLLVAAQPDNGCIHTHSQYACALPWLHMLALCLLLYHCYLLVLSPAGVCVCVFTTHRFAPAQLVYPLLATAIHSSVQSHQSIITVILICILPAGVLIQAQWERRGHHPPSRRHHYQTKYRCFVLRCPIWSMPRMQWKMLP